MNRFFLGHRLLLVGLVLALISVALFIYLARTQQSAPSAKISVVQDRVTVTGAPSPQPIARRFNAGSLVRQHSGNASHVLSGENQPSVPTVSDRPRFIPVKSSGSRQLTETEADPQLQSAAASVREYRKAFSKNPVGNNREITRALSGKNSHGARYLPTGAQIDDKGQLTDRWDQPVFFHQISSTVMEVRSAGPDRVMWTADDEVLR